MSHWNNLPQLRLGVYPTPFYRLENISRIYNKSIWIKRDDLCGVALGGNKVRKLEYLLADAQKQGCDTVFTTEYSIRTGMEAVYTLCNIDRGVPEVWGSVYDIRDLLYATSKLLDGKKPLEFLLPTILPLLGLVKEPLTNNVVVDLLKKYNIV